LILIFQRLHQAAIEPSLRWIFRRTYPTLRSVAYRHVSSAKRAKLTPVVWGVSLVCNLYWVGDRTEPCGTPACMDLGMDISPFTETLNCLCERNDPISLNKVEVNLRPTVSQPVCPGVRRPSGTFDQFFFLLEISFRQLRLCYFVAPSLTRERVSNLLLQLLLGLARAVTLGSKSRRTHGHILLSHLGLL
jgi:hypothetical protein